MTLFMAETIFLQLVDVCGVVAKRKLVQSSLLLYHVHTGRYDNTHFLRSRGGMLGGMRAGYGIHKVEW